MFPGYIKLVPLVKSPFTCDVDIPEMAQEKFIEILNVTAIKLELSFFSETEFWIYRFVEYTTLASIVLEIIVPFPAFKESESGFSRFLQIKAEHRNRLKVASSTPRIKKLAEKGKQLQASH
jgi:hypothetical protein